MKIESHYLAEGGMALVAKFQPIIEEHTAHMVMAEVARAIAAKYVAEHYQEVIAFIKPEAIATLVAAEVGADISKTLKEDVRGKDRVERIVEREIYQRGIFGGIKRIG